MKKVIKGLVKGTFSPLGLASIGIESDLFHNSVTDGTMDAQKARERQDLINKLPKETRKKLKTFKQFQAESKKQMPDLGGGGGGTNAITMKSKSKTPGKRVKDAAKLVTTPFRVVLGIKPKQDAKEKFASEELGGGTPPTNSTGPNVCTDPDTVVVKKKRNAWNKGKKYMKGSRKQWMV